MSEKEGQEKILCYNCVNWFWTAKQSEENQEDREVLFNKCLISSEAIWVGVAFCSHFSEINRQGLEQL